MDFAEIKNLWLASKAGILEATDLVEVNGTEGQRSLGGRWYKCPCGEPLPHAASRKFLADGSMSEMLNCYQTDQQWVIKPVDVKAIIRAEEKAYFALLEKSGPLVKKIVAKRGWSEETERFLYETHGINPEISRMHMGLEPL